MIGCSLCFQFVWRFWGAHELFRWCVHCPMGGGPTNGWRVQGMLSFTYQRSVLEWTGSIVWMRTICSLMLTFCKAFFVDAKLTKRAVFNKKGGTQQTCGIFFAAEKKRLHGKNDGISMIIRVMASRGHQPWDLSDLVASGTNSEVQIFWDRFFGAVSAGGRFFFGDST